jgi:hypothetical protein
LRSKLRCGIVVFGKGAEAQGPRSKIYLRLNQPCRGFITHTEEYHHGEEEKGQEEVEVTELRAPRIGAALSVFGFREVLVISQSGRTEVRPLSFLGSLFFPMIPIFPDDLCLLAPTLHA